MKITAKDLKSQRYQGSFSKQYEGDVEIEGNLGLVFFDNIWCTGSITAGLGTYINAGESIDAGGSISTDGLYAGEYIEAGGYINAGGLSAGGYIDAGGYINAGGLSAGGFIKAGESINVDGSIDAGRFISAGGSINVDGLYAGGSIDACGSINAGEYGITAGYEITCKTTLLAKFRIIAGISPFQDGSENTITCGKLESGTIIGNLVETGLPEDRPNQCHGGQTGKFCSECGEKLKENN